MKRIISLAIIFLVVFTCVSCGPKEQQAVFNPEEQLALAERLFSEGNYEEVILTLETVLEVEPANVRGYLRLSDAYLAKGEKEKALALLQKGLDLTGDKEIAGRIQGMTQTNQGFVAVAAGWYNTLLLSEEGEVYYCGLLQKQVGAYQINDYSTAPEKIEGLEHIVALFTNRGRYMPSASYALRDNGDMYAINEQSPFEPRERSYMPSKVLSNVKYVASMGDTLYYIDRDGTLYGRGDNTDGQIGRGIPYAEEPFEDFSFDNWQMEDGMILRNIQKVVTDDIFIDESAFSRQYAAAFALSETGILYGWGTFGIREEGGRIVKVCYNEPMELAQGVKDMDMTQGSLYMVTEDDKLQYIPYDAIGQGGFDFTDVPCGNAPVEFVECGNDHFLVLDTLGRVYCGGANWEGQLGIPRDAEVRQDTVYMPLGDTRAKAISAKGDSSYAIAEDGTLLAWGNNYYGQLGNGRRGGQLGRQEAALVLDGVKAVYAAPWSSYILTEADELYIAGSAWGYSGGDGQHQPAKAFEGVRFVWPENGAIVTNDNVLYLPTVNGYEREMEGVLSYAAGTGASAGQETQFVIKTDHSLWGWGGNYSGALGNGEWNDPDSTEDKSVAEPIRIMDDCAKIVVNGYGRQEEVAYILTLGGDVYMCGAVWGYGQKGSTFWFGVLQRYLTPQKILSGAKDIYASQASPYLLYILEDDSLHVYGTHDRLLFQGMEEYKNVDNDTAIWTDVAKATANMILDKDGEMYIYGQDSVINLWELDEITWPQKTQTYGVGNLICEKMMEGIKDIASSDAVYDHFLAVTQDGKLYAWGDNQYGQLGLGEAGSDENIFEVALP